VAKPTDEQILAALRGGGRCMTYVVANRLSMLKHRGFDTAFVLRRLKVMEKAGKVERVQTSYAVQICWRAVEVNGNQSSGAQSTAEASKGGANA
jgi:hypothetical protein